MPGSDVPKLRANALAVQALTPALMARAQAYLFLVAGAIGALGVLLPHPEHFDEFGMLCVQGSSLLTAALLYAHGEHLPERLLSLGPFAATTLTSAVLVLSGDSTSAYLLFYLWVAFYAFYFLSRRDAMLLGGFTIVNYALVILGFRLAGAPPTGGGGEDIPALALLAATVIVAGTFIVLLRERVGRLIRELTELATTDPLTGLLNRRGFHQSVVTEYARARRDGRPFSLVLGDLDHFKQLNDRVGHQVADEALQRVAQLIGAGKRLVDPAARIGGEEFALVLPGAGPEDAYLVAERLRVQIGEALGGGPEQLTMSFGVATYPDHASSDDDLLRVADDALFAAKTLGRDRTVLHSGEIAGILAGASEGTSAQIEAQLTTVLSLAGALDVRDTGAAHRSQTVGRYCEMMARGLDLAEERVNRVRVAGILHDIGKIGVAESILDKPGPLTPKELEHVRRHPEIGARLLGGPGLEDIRDWVLSHHERPDGLGYPRGLAGEAIPLEASILAVADAYHAMTSDRPYRAALDAAAARRELLAGAGAQFAAPAVEALLSALARERDGLVLPFGRPRF